MAAVPPSVTLPIKQPCPAYVSFAVTPEELWIQLAEGERELSELMSDLNCGRPLLPVSGIVSGRELYAAAYTADQRFYRVVVIGQQSTGVYMVHYVDYGNSEPKRSDELRALDTRFARLPRQAVRCHLDGVSTSASAELLELVLDKPVSVTALAQSPVTRSYSIDIDAEGIGSVLALLRGRYPVSQLTRFAQPLDLPVGREEDVLVLLSLRDGSGAGLICFRLLRFARALDDLMAALAAVPLSRLPLKCGVPCVALCSDRRYRAVVAEVRDGMQVLVRLVDYGREVLVNDEDLYVVPSQFFELPAQAMLCRPAVTVTALPYSPCPATLKIVGFDQGLPVASIQFNQLLLPVGSGSFSGVPLGTETATTDSLPWAATPLPAALSLDVGARGGDPSAAASACVIRKQILAVGQVVRCFVTLVANPNYVAVHTADSDPARLEQLQSAVNEYCNSLQARPLDQRLACAGAACAVRFADDLLWYRGRLKSIERDARGAPVAADVLLVDFGNLLLHCPMSELLEMPPELAAALPEQAIQLEFQTPICVSLADFLAAFRAASEIVVQVVALRGNMTVARLTGDPENNAVRGVFAGDLGAGPPADPTSLGPSSGSQKANKLQGNSRAGVARGGESGFGPAPAGPPGPRQQLGRRSYGDPRLPPINCRVDVVLTCCEGPSRFWVCLAEHETELEKIALDIVSFMASDSRRGINAWDVAPAPGMPCLAQSNSDWRWYRARIEEVVPKGQLKVYFVDYGNSEIVSLSKIADLPPALQQTPSLAIQCRLTGIDIPDNQFDSAVNEFTKLLSHRPIQMVVRSPVSQSGSVPVTLFVSNADSSVSELLFQAGFGEQVMHTPDTGAGEPAAAASISGVGRDNKGSGGGGSSKPASARLGYKQLVLPQPSTTVAATGVYVENPSSFWCHLLVSAADVKRVADEMAKLNGGGASTLSAIATAPTAGQPCCARFSNDRQWYRARVRESSGNQCLVDFVDYGNSEWVNFPHDVRQLPSGLLAISPQAVHCTLAATGRRGAPAAMPSNAWTTEQCQEFEKAVLYQSVMLEVLGVADDNSLLVNVNVGDSQLSELLKSTGAGGSSAAIAPAQRIRPDDGRVAPPQVIAVPASRRDQPLAVAVDSGRTLPASSAIASQAVTVGTRERVRVVWIVAPDHFYCHRESCEMQLQRISRGVDEAVRADRPLRRPAAGTLCIASYSLDGQWYRALIKALSPASCTLYFIDYGNSASEAGNRPLLEMDPRLAEIPPQAINCKLRGIAPKSLKGEWGDDARNKMELVISSGELYATFIAVHRDSNLVDLNLADGTSVADELVSAGVAKPLRCDVPLGGSQTHLGSPSQSAGAADVGSRAPPAGAGLLINGEQPSPRRTGLPSQSGFASTSTRQDAGHGMLAGRPEYDQSQVAPQSAGRYRSSGAAATGPASPVWPGPGSPGASAASSSSGASSWSDASANRKGGTQHRPSGNIRPPPGRNDWGGNQRATGRRDYGVNDAEAIGPLGRVGGSPEGRLPFDRQGEAAVGFGDGLQRPGRSYRRPVERFGQQPRRPRDAGSQQKQEQPAESLADNGEDRGRQSVGGWTPRGETPVARQRGKHSKDKEGLQQPDDWLEEEKQSSSTAQRVEIKNYQPTDLTAGSAYAAYLAYMPDQPVSDDDAGSSLLIWVQLRQNEALVESVQESVRQCTSEASGEAAPSLSSAPAVGTPCLALYSADSAWYRAVITHVDIPADAVRVHFVDYGNSDTVRVSGLREIPAAILQASPPLAICCKVTDTSKVMDGLCEVTVDAVREKLECHTLMVTFSESVSGYDGRSILPCHVALLDESECEVENAAVDAACAAVAAVKLADVEADDQPEVKSQSGDVDDVTIIVGYSPAELQPGIQYRAMLAAYGTSPDEFWLHLERDAEALANLAAEIVHYVDGSTSDAAAFTSAQPTVGASCLAKYSADGLWYRAEVTLLHPDTDTVELLYVDYGNTDIVQWPSRSVLQLPAKLGQLPCFAVLSSLSSDSSATLQDFENAGSESIVAVFCSAPTDHRKATWCTLMRLDHPAEGDEVGSADVQAIIVNDEEEQLAEPAEEERSGEAAEEEQSGKAAEEECLGEAAAKTSQQKEQEEEQLASVAESTLAKLTAPEALDSGTPFQKEAEEDEGSSPSAATVT